MALVLYNYLISNLLDTKNKHYAANYRRIHEKLVHITDWLPTILRIADIEQNPDEDTLDGVDQYDSIFGDETEVNPR